MAVRIIIGRAGSGKTLHCFNAIVEKMRADPLGDPIYWIVPKQETFTAERELTCTSGLSGFTRTRIVSFELFGEEILAECGGTAIPQVTALGRQMIIGHLLRKHQEELIHYKSTARQIGLAAELDATFAEFERCGKRIEDLSELIAELMADPTQQALESFIHKLTDIRLLYSQYLAFLGHERLDPHRRLEAVLSNLPGCKRAQRATIFVDGFLEFTDYERKMLAGLAKVCREMEITLLLDPQSPVFANPHHLPDEMSLFYRTEETFRKLWFAFSEAEIKPELRALKTSNRFTSPSLQLIEQHFAHTPPPSIAAVEAIDLIQAPDRRTEVDAAARQVIKLVKSGLRYRDIAVLMRDLGEYHELIDASFIEHNIPYFVDRRRSAAHHPLLQFIRAAMQIALHHWPHQSVMTLLKTELAGLSRDAVDELENYVLLHRIHGVAWSNPKPWAYCRKSPHDSDEPSLKYQQAEVIRFDGLRQTLARQLAPLTKLFADGSTVPVRQIVLQLFAVFEQFKIRDTLRKWIRESAASGQLEEQGEHQQVWAELVALLDQMVDVLGEQALSPADFVDVLETGLDRFDLALTPPTADQVIVGSIDRTRSARPKAAILLGLNDNQFPRPPRDGSILSDGERRTLSKHKVELDPDTQRALLDEQLLGYIGFTRASQSLCLTRSIADDEARPQAPSSFWQRLRAQFPSLEPTNVPREAKSAIACIGTPRQLVTALMHWVRHGDLVAESGWRSLYHWLATRECSNDAIDIMRYRAWKSLTYQNKAELSPATARLLYQNPFTASVSRIESFAACPFKHFLQYDLGLSEREEQEVTAIDLGNACHSILEQIIRKMVADKIKWSDRAPGETHAAIRALSKQVAEDLRGELMLSSARNEYILHRIEQTIAQVMEAQSAAGQRGKFVPWKTELRFGDGREIPPLVLQTDNGNELRLRGQIDRVDLVENEAAFAVIDYKYRESALLLDRVYHGLSLQLLTYLLVLQRNVKLADRPLVPAAAFYVRLLRTLEKIKHPRQAILPDDPLFHLQVKPRGIIDWNHRRLLDLDHDSGSSDVVSLFVNKGGVLGKKNASDGCESVEFAAMLQTVERRLTQLTDRIISGDISLSPYLIGNASPCVHCDFRSVCRFDVPINHYNKLQPIKREEVLLRVLADCPPAEPPSAAQPRKTKR